jgi:hypothetical protein
VERHTEGKQCDWMVITLETTTVDKPGKRR